MVVLQVKAKEKPKTSVKRSWVHITEEFGGVFGREEGVRVLNLQRRFRVLYTHGIRMWRLQ